MGKTDKFTELMRREAVTPRVIYDLGSFDGAQALELANAWPHVAIVAFEPDPELAGACVHRLYGHPRISVVETAVGKKSEEAVFFKAVGRNRECGSLLRPNGKYFEPMPVAEIRVPVIRLDEWIDLHFIPPPDTLWLDVQGTEWDVLLGLGKYLAGVKMIWAEVAHKAYYEDQILHADLDRHICSMGFAPIHFEEGIPEWFGDVCYKRTS